MLDDIYEVFPRLTSEIHSHVYYWIRSIRFLHILLLRVEVVVVVGQNFGHFVLSILIDSWAL